MYIFIVDLLSYLVQQNQYLIISYTFPQRN